MHAWLCETLDGVDALKWRELPTPEPQAGEVRIAIQAASLNFPDSLTIVGKYQFKPDPALRAGLASSRAGSTPSATASATSRSATRWRASRSGGFATHAVVQAARVLPLPPGFDLDDGAAFAFTYGTSHHALMDRGAAAGRRDRAGAGRRRRRGHGRGADRQGSRRARDRRRLQRRQVRVPDASLGADETINYSSANLRDALKALTGGKGPDVIYDPVGGDLAEPAFRSIAWRGRYLVVGFAGGGIPALPLNLALLKGASVVGVFWGDFTRREPKAFAHGMAQLAQWYAAARSSRPSTASCR
jgi:NADPH2:quinone reductase